MKKCVVNTLDLSKQIHIASILKLVCTLLNYRVLGTSTAAIFLSNDHSLYMHLYTSDEVYRYMKCLISFVWHQSTCQERVESDNMQNEKFLLTVGPIDRSKFK